MDNNELRNIKNIINSNLVPYFGKLEPYFFGNSITGASTEPNGDMTFLIGPDYTSPNYIRKESLYIDVDGTSYKINPEMHRIRDTGIFYGETSCSGIQLILFEITIENQPFVARIITVTNMEGNSKSYNLKAEISSYETDCTLVNLNGVKYDSILITQDTSKYCFGNKETINWAERSSFISFNSDCTVNQVTQSSCILSTVERELVNNQSEIIGLYHYQFYNNSIPHDEIYKYIKDRKPSQDILTSIYEWNKWISEGNNYNYKINNTKCSDVIQSLLLCVKMQQNRDGGVIAGIRKYANSYIRDTYGCSRILLSTGHHTEVRKIIMNIFSKWEQVRFIPNWWSMGSNTFIGHSFNNDAAEVTAYYILMIRDYFNLTKDYDTVEIILESILWAVNEQIKFFQSNNWLIDFNGDETEQYCCNNDGEEYGGVRNWNSKNWSFSSACAAIASIDFLINYLNETSKSQEVSKYKEYVNLIRDNIDKYFWNDELSIHNWAISKDDLSFVDGIMTNYCLIPLWISVKLNYDRQIDNALSMKKYIKANGFLQNCVGICDGFCGHSLGYLLYDLATLKDDKAKDVYNTILNSDLLSAWGTISEFYGPGCVPNGHNFRGFEGGILGNALIKMHI